jgi:hypothetical protein
MKLEKIIFILFYFMLLRFGANAQIAPVIKPMLFYICKGSSVALDLGICPKPGAIISWKAEGGLEISTALSPNISPIKTTNYLFECRHPDGLIVLKTAKVVVIEDVKLSFEKNLLECMDGSNLEITGEIVGDIPSDLAIKFSFTWEISTANDKKDVITTSKVSKVTIKTPIIALTNVNHEEQMKVNLQIKIEDKNMCLPVEKIIKLRQLWINYFRDAASGSAKDWKIVIGNPIESSVNATSDCKCDWTISGPTKTWILENYQATTLTNNNLKIKYSSIAQVVPGGYQFIGKNTWLGTANGQIKLVCTDARGNSRTRLLSEQVVSNPLTVKIFFNMYDDAIGRTSSHFQSTSVDENVRFSGLVYSLNPLNTASYHPPLWYLFWKDGNVIPRLNDVNSIGEPLFVWMASSPTVGVIEYGGWLSTTINGLPFQRILLKNNATRVNSGVGRTITDLDRKTFPFGGSGKHLQCLAETMRHELYHKFIDNTWGGVGPSRISHFDTDGIPDNEEILGYIADILPKTLFNTSDTYNIQYQPPAQFITPFYDYSDNELRCLVMERDVATPLAVSSNPTPLTVLYYPSLDWSNSINNINWIY